jgi:hypothetical protein
VFETNIAQYISTGKKSIMGKLFEFVMLPVIERYF